MITDGIVHLSYVKTCDKFCLLGLPFYNEYISGLYSEENPSRHDLCMDC